MCFLRTEIWFLEYLFINIQQPLLTCFEELAGRREDDLVGGHRVLLAGESHVEEVLLLPKLSELPTEVRVVIFPCETKFLILHVKLSNCSILKKSEHEMTSRVVRLTVSRRMLLEAGQAKGLDNLPDQDD